MQVLPPQQNRHENKPALDIELLASEQAQAKMPRRRRLSQWP